MTVLDLATATGDSRKRATPSRVAWVDIAKGWCIVLVVTMHSALGVGVALGDTGWLHAIVAFAKPFRMPDFFMIAGLFVASAIALPWRTYLDRKLVHFAYFYALWLLIVLAAKSSELGILAPLPFIRAYLWGFINPFSTMWFIQILPILFIMVRLLRNVPLVPLLAAAVALHLAAALFQVDSPYTMESRMTGWPTIDNFALFFVYFLIGTRARSAIFQFAAAAAARPYLTLAALLVWGFAEALGVQFGVAGLAGMTLVFGLAGACAVVAASSLLARFGLMNWLAYCGRHSLIIYLSFVLPMAVSRVILLKSGLITNVGWISLIVAATAIVVPLVANRLTRGTGLGFLFTRPNWARLSETRRLPSTLDA